MDLILHITANEGTEKNSVWVQALPGPMYLGLETGPLCPIFCTRLQEPFH